MGSLALIFLATSKVPWRSLKIPVLSLSAVGWLIISVVGATVASVLFESLRLSLLSVGLAQRPVPFPDLIRLQLKSRPWAFLLPGSIAADGYLALLLPSEGERSKLARALLAQRAWGLAGWMFTLSLVLGLTSGLALLSEHWPILAHPALWAVFGFTGLAGGLLIWPTTTPWRLLAVSLTAPLVTAPWLCAADHGTQAHLGLPMAMGIQGLMMVGIAMPVTLGGFGLQEFLLLKLASQPSYQPGPLMAYSLLLHLHRIVPAAIGGMLRRSPAIPSQSP